MTDWIAANGPLVWWMTAISTVLFFGSLFALPVVLCRIPADYLLRPPKRRSKPLDFWRAARLTIRFVGGVVLIVCGVLMLVLPGQGLLAIAAGLLILPFRRRHLLIQRLLSHPRVLTPVNWIREKRHRPPLLPPAT